MATSRHNRAPATDPNPSGFYRLGRLLARHPWIVIGCWVVLVGAGVLLLPRFEAHLTGPPLTVSGSESRRSQELLAREFSSPFAEQNLVVFESDTLTVQDPAYQRVVADALQAVATLPHVASVIGPLDPRADDQVSGDGHVAAAVVGLSGSSRTRQRLVPELTSAAEAAATDEVRVYVTGRSPLVTELVEQEQEDLARAERLGLPGALLVLILASGSLVAAGIPVLLALVGMGVTFGVLGAATAFTSFNLFVPNIAAMLGLGVGIDYSLFVVHRYREELSRGADPDEAVAVAVATSGKTIFFSGGTVLLSLAGLLIVDAPIFRELAIGAMTAVGVMVAGALTLVPAALSLIGHHVNRLALPVLGRALEHPDPDHGFWARWARGIMRHPVWWAGVAVLALLALAAPVSELDLGLSTNTSELDERSAGQGREILRREFNEGVISPIRVVVVSPDGPLDDQDLDAVARLSAALRAEAGVADVVSITELLDRFAGNHAAVTLAAAAEIPEAAAAASDLVNVGQGRDVTVIHVVPQEPPDSNAALRLVRRIRDTTIPQAVGGARVDVLVGGLSAQIVDISEESSRKLPIVGGLVVALTFVLLAVIFRSLILPLKAILMNLLSIAAAYGMVVLVFQEGFGEGLLDFESPGTTQVYLPLLTFAILFGLSMDYELFLLGRMKEEWERTGDNEAAVARGLERTARVITSAAAIMVVVFSAFTFSRLTEVKELGFSLAVAVFVDATLVRVILVPAAMRLMGRWNWWFPSWLDRIVPRVDLAEDLGGKPVPATLAEGKAES